MRHRLTHLRALFLGLLAAAAIVLILVAASGNNDERLHWLVLLPLLALLGVAAFTPFVGWPRRLVRGALGFAVAAAAGFATFAGLDARTDWFHGLERDRFLLLVLVLHAAIPGGIAAAADSPGRGLALAGGLTLGLGLASWLAGNAHPGYIILIAVGALTGALVHGLDRRRRAP